MSTWRKKETFQESGSQIDKHSIKKKKEPMKGLQRPVENFANIEVFDVLRNNENLPKENLPKENLPIVNLPKENLPNVNLPKENKNIKEGFDFIGDSYFRNTKRIKLFNIKGLTDIFKKLINLFLSPLENIDALFERLLYELLRILLAFLLDECNPNIKKTSYVDDVKKSFVWSNRDYFTNMKEGMKEGLKKGYFTWDLSRRKQFKTTIDNLYSIHTAQFKEDDLYNALEKIPDIDIIAMNQTYNYNENLMKARLGEFYVDELNKIKIGDKTPESLSKKELFDFNNLIDNKLEKKKVRDIVFTKFPNQDWTRLNDGVYPLPGLVYIVRPTAAPNKQPGQGELTECEKQKNGMQKSLKEYSQFLKKQIYMLFLIPISMYVVYNVYYLFFFKDYILPVKTDDGYVHGDLDAGFDENCVQKEPEKKCNERVRHPIFPDWENIFHYYEKNQADFLFEFVFKPTKMVYSFLNAVKVFFRGKNTIGSFFTGSDKNLFNLKDDFPYLFLLATFAIVYTVLLRNGSDILGVMVNLVKFEIDNFKIGNINISMLAASMTSMFLIFSLFKKGLGIGLKDGIMSIFQWLTGCALGNASKKIAPAINQDGAKNEEEEEEENPNKFGDFLKRMQTNAVENYSKLADPEKRSWLIWCFLNTTHQPLVLGGTPLSFILKLILMIIFWIFKFSAAAAMVPLSIYILIIYFFYNSLYGIYDNADDKNDTSAKIELIDRIIYTKLYDIFDVQDPPKEDALPGEDTNFCRTRKNEISYRNYPRVIFKILSWGIIFFMTEIFAFTIISQGHSDVKNLPKGQGEDEVRFYNALTTALRIIYVVLGIFVALWCLYKLWKIVPNHVKFYRMDLFQSINKEDNEEKEAFHRFKTFEFDKSACNTEYDEKIGIANVLIMKPFLTPSLKVFTNGDELNKKYVEEYATRSTTLARWSEKITKMGNKLKGSLPDFNKMFDFSTRSSDNELSPEEKAESKRKFEESGNRLLAKSRQDKKTA